MNDRIHEKKISVIVPVYKAEAYLARCVDSILCQTYEELEIILVDDGSPDGCGVMCDGYEKKDKRVVTIHKKNGGSISAWQAGVDASTGVYLCFVDSDDWIDPDMVAHMAAFLVGNKKEVVCCNFLVEKGSSAKPHFHGATPGVYEGEALEGLKTKLLGYENRTIGLSRCMKLITRELITDNLKYCDLQLRMGEDVSIMVPVFFDTERVVIMKHSLYYHYFFNEASMAHKYDTNIYQGIQLLYESIKKVYAIKGRINEESQYEREYIYLLLLVLKNEIRANKVSAYDRVVDVATDPETKRLLLSHPMKMTDRASKILYEVLRNPSRLNIRVARFIFWLYDACTKGK